MAKVSVYGWERRIDPTTGEKLWLEDPCDICGHKLKNALLTDHGTIGFDCYLNLLGIPRARPTFKDLPESALEGIAAGLAREIDALSDQDRINIAGGHFEYKQTDTGIVKSFIPYSIPPGAKKPVVHSPTRVEYSYLDRQGKQYRDTIDLIVDRWSVLTTFLGYDKWLARKIQAMKPINDLYHKSLRIFLGEERWNRSKKKSKRTVKKSDLPEFMKASIQDVIQTIYGTKPANEPEMLPVPPERPANWQLMHEKKSVQSKFDKLDKDGKALVLDVMDERVKLHKIMFDHMKKLTFTPGTEFYEIINSRGKRGFDRFKDSFITAWREYKNFRSTGVLPPEHKEEPGGMIWPRKALVAIFLNVIDFAWQLRRYVEGEIVYSTTGDAIAFELNKIEELIDNLPEKIEFRPTAIFPEDLVAYSKKDKKRRHENGRKK